MVEEPCQTKHTQSHWYQYQYIASITISAVFKHSVLRLWEIYALENVVFYIAVYGPHKP